MRERDAVQASVSGSVGSGSGSGSGVGGVTLAFFSSSAMMLESGMTELPIVIWIMKDQFSTIPTELEEAAMVDGCNSLQSLIKILVPVVKPSMVTVGLLAFLEAWNNFMIPLYTDG